MQIILPNFLFLTMIASAASLGMLRRTRVASDPIQRSLSQSFFSLPEEMEDLFSEDNQSFLTHMGYHSMSMSFLSMPLPTIAPTRGPVVDAKSTNSPSVSSPDRTVTDAPYNQQPISSSPVPVKPKTVSPSDGLSSSDSNDSVVKPIKTPVQTIISKNTSKSNDGKSQEWRPDIVLPVVFLALAALLILGVVAARRRRRGTVSVSSIESSLSPSHSDSSMVGNASQGVEI